MHSSPRSVLAKLVRLRIIWLVLVIVIGAVILKVTVPFQLSTASSNQSGKKNVLTASYDMQRTGQNRQETRLTTANLNKDTFGMLSSFPVIGSIQAQPLYVSNVRIGGKSHNVVYVATTADRVYAFDADGGANATGPLWQTNLGLSEHAPGIYGTPVIALEQQGEGTLYVITNDSLQSQHLHALDITNGQPRPGSPALINPEGFRPATTYQRTGLALVQGVIYAGWMGLELSGAAEHGWVMAFDAHTLKLIDAFNTTADVNTAPSGKNKGNDLETGNPGSVWQSTTGLSVDAEGNVYPIVSNGPFNGRTSYGDSFLKLRLINGKFSVIDYFTPFNQQCLKEWDYDLGSSGNLLLPDQTGRHRHLMLGVSKSGRLYLVDRDDPGGFVEVPGLSCASPQEQQTNVDRIVQESQIALLPGLFMAPVYWSTPSGKQYIYVSGANADTGQGDTIKAFELTNGQLNLTPVMHTSLTYGYPGAGIAVSSDGDKAGTGILWALQPAFCHGGGCNPQDSAILRAYDATNLNRELYNSEQNVARDGLDSYQKFTRPVVADGKVFVCSQSILYIYGQLHP
ncbi:conserved hypothetical protein [Ktedonobacter racemifer DSM 44963]|uniref:Pyrrolo-quinoline quinone repeat domain-containing protein n=2 Tax=Ktedonobacter racemifer TaxID=363277 RepID=D6TY52_KTERA|nr:conserved hypothetical protein [Ktedonobacter racemifer DSM 44963]